MLVRIMIDLCPLSWGTLKLGESRVSWPVVLLGGMNKKVEIKKKKDSELVCGKIVPYLRFSEMYGIFYAAS